MKLAALLVLLPLVAAAGIPSNEGENWAVLVAGSSGWFNYRHQSDICHAYQIMHASGIPDERIIVMMYDDIAGHSSNPFPGKIFNHPEGEDVYAGVPHDYTGSEVTPEIFLAVLQGNEAAVNGIGSGKVVKSGPNDRIFVNLDDHGAVGLFAFPSSELYADEFEGAVSDMHAAGKYKEMMIYMEACESGSMFEDLYPESLKAYALSASNPTESSWAAYCDNPYGVCLGDEFSVGWMEDTDNNDPATETLETQFTNTRDKTFGSSVMQWGDISLDSQVVATFFAPTSNAPKNYNYKPTPESTIATQDVPLVMLERKLKSAKNDFEAKNIAEEIESLKERRQFVQTTMQNIAESVTGDHKKSEEMMVKKNTKVSDWSCYKPAAKAFSKNCFNLGQSTYALTTVHTLLNLCDAGYDTTDIISSIKTVCSFPTIFNAY